MNDMYNLYKVKKLLTSIHCNHIYRGDRSSMIVCEKSGNYVSVDKFENLLKNENTALLLLDRFNTENDKVFFFFFFFFFFFCSTSHV